ncbi:hypothetical protein POSPLADRAFT_1127062 [Postia placenta MAD-698-R-SB12]|uniref:Uncharacterized protein n=1 Tax=Postia placenta MAD-698-R-SB12 TaxID=670580 RepID=A0A1X6NHW3_9APHY|nr:hypothetical protein POSPLADRAFT_1127062 [Postia placenta MAD-698-R-SB12]OSX68221.1 hypothetical protein POSPLADRAFT_1127062 [Postia placenta MAD-698-R-SB12]
MLELPSEQAIEGLLESKLVKIIHILNSVGLTFTSWCSFQQNCINYASAGQRLHYLSHAPAIIILSAILIYYVGLNLPHDVRRLWGRRSIATLLSATNWFAIIGTIIINSPLPTNTTQVWSVQFVICASYGWSYLAVFIVNSAISSLVSALRVHAVSGGNWRWVLPVWILGIVPVGTNTWLVTHDKWFVLPQIGCVLVDAITPVVVVITTRASVVVSDILVVAATWYYIGRTSSVRTQLVRDVWVGRPNLTTVMFRDGTLYFLIVSLLNIFDLIMTTISISSSYIYVLDVTNLTTAMSIILISHFLICIREAAERSIQAFSSQSLSFVNSQGNPVPRRWLSSIEFAADIADPSAENSNAYAFSDLEDGLDSLRGEDNAVEESNDGIELEELAASVHSIDARIP